jgi:hypothetical protein
MSSIEAVDTYGASWNVNDADERRALLKKSWADGGIYVDPTAHMTGLEALV